MDLRDRLRTWARQEGGVHARRRGHERASLRLLILAAALALHAEGFAQDLEPRRWAHLPVGTNVLGLSYLHTRGDVNTDPVLDVVRAEVTVDTLVASYAHVFDFLGKTARLDVILPRQEARWEGRLAGTPTAVSREGFADPWVRLSVNVAGAPALAGEEYLRYRAAHPVSTIVGLALALMLPLGEYMEDKLLNLGQNRVVVRPQAGVVHTRGPWSYELTGSAYVFGDNPEFFGGTRREQDPRFAVQAHVVRSFSNRSWVAASAGASWGATSTIDGVPKEDERSDFLSSISFGLPVGNSQALKLVYQRAATLEDVGSDTDSLVLSWSVRF